MAQDHVSNGTPTIVSFHTTQPYYRNAANMLRADCRRLQIPHFVEPLPHDESLSWDEACRYKVKFFHRMHREVGAFLWVDADTRILAPPLLLTQSSFDLIGFGGQYRYIRDQDPYAVARFWVPSILMINDTLAGREFVDLMAEIERTTSKRVTDDWVLQEAWTSHQCQLNVAFLAPKLVARTAQEVTTDSVFLLGQSGNVSAHRTVVEQHEPKYHDRRLRAKALETEAVEAMKNGDRSNALIFIKRAAQLDPGDSSLTGRYASYAFLNGDYSEALGTLDAFLKDNPHAYSTRQQRIKLGLSAGVFDSIDQHIDALLSTNEKGYKQVAQLLAFDVSIERLASRTTTSHDERTPLWWPQSPFQDCTSTIVNRYVIHKETGVPARRVTTDKTLLAGGSSLRHATSRSIVCGAGAHDTSVKVSPDAAYVAVRGPRTRGLVLAQGISCPPIYGDPAMLLPRYFSPHVQRTHRLGFVGEPTELVSLHVDQLVKVIPTPVPTYEDLENFIRSILECEAILSTSYYGKVIADAYGVPAQWCTFASNRSDELALTHVDYDEAYGRGQQHVSLELHHDEDINLSLAARFNTATGFTPHTDDYLAAFTDAIGNLQTNKFGV